MMNHLGRNTDLPSSLPKINSSFSIYNPNRNRENNVRPASLATITASRAAFPSFFSQEKISPSRIVQKAARRRSVRHGVEDEEEDDEEEYGYNEDIAMIEVYSQYATEEALIVHAVVDAEDVQVLIFKGFSSSLSYGTSPDPTRSILPARAEIKSIDRVKGPFDPSNIHYIDKDLPWESFKSNFITNL